MFAKKGCWYVFLFYQIGGPLPVFKFGIIPDLNIRIDSWVKPKGVLLLINVVRNFENGTGP